MFFCNSFLQAIYKENNCLIITLASSSFPNFFLNSSIIFNKLIKKVLTINYKIISLFFLQLEKISCQSCSTCIHFERSSKMYISSPSDVFCRNGVLEISQNSQGNTCARVSFLIKLQAPSVAASEGILNP